MTQCTILIGARREWDHARNFTVIRDFFIATPHLMIFYFSVAQQSNSGLGRLIVEVSISHTIRHTHTHTQTPSRIPLNE
jgi:hypothetical protein